MCTPTCTLCTHPHVPYVHTHMYPMCTPTLCTHPPYVHTHMYPMCTPTCTLCTHPHVPYVHTHMYPMYTPTCILCAHPHVPYVHTHMYPMCTHTCYVGHGLFITFSVLASPFVCVCFDPLHNHLFTVTADGKVRTCTHKYYCSVSGPLKICMVVLREGNNFLIHFVMGMYGMERRNVSFDPLLCNNRVFVLLII